MSLDDYYASVRYWSDTRRERLNLDGRISEHLTRRPTISDADLMEEQYLFKNEEERFRREALQKRCGLKEPNAKEIVAVDGLLKTSGRTLAQTLIRPKNRAVAKHEAALADWEVVLNRLQEEQSRITGDLTTARDLARSYYDHKVWKTLPIFKREQIGLHGGAFYRGTLGSRLMFNASFALVAMDSFMLDMSSVEFSTDPDTALTFAINGESGDKASRWDPVLVITHLKEQSPEILIKKNLVGTKFTITVERLLADCNSRVFRVVPDTKQ